MAGPGVWLVTILSWWAWPLMQSCAVLSLLQQRGPGCQGTGAAGCATVMQHRAF